MFRLMSDLLGDGDYTIVEDFELAPSQPHFGSTPQYLYTSPVGAYLDATMKSGGGLWNHQRIALERIGADENVVISTSTASGKSLIFRSAAFHRALQSPAERVLVFYPLKALASDQFSAWADMAHRLGLPDGFIGRIDGSVERKRREAILRQARIVLMTPDVCHAWLMSSLALPVVKSFVGAVNLVVLDEAHTLEGVFGSNFSFFFRRLLAAHRLIKGDAAGASAIKVIAATATIANPSKHLQLLTGLDFSSVGEEEDGSPHHCRRCVHLACTPGDEMQIATALQAALVSQSGDGGFITFVDSRKGVEQLAVATNRTLKEQHHKDAVMPYRAGLDAEDRKAIEQQLQRGTLRGVISTSALELGIDLPHLQVGFNIGVPPSRKAYRQRLGRVGRNGPGLFVVIADAKAFRSYGTTYREYHEMSVEPSYLYLDNRFMQFAHARCLADELESAGAPDRAAPPSRVDWPNGFSDVYKAARPGGDRPREFDGIAQLGGDIPQYGYPLRNVGEVNFRIRRGEHGEAFGEATLSQALRECYPGATYYHLAAAYKVQAWNTSGYLPFIKVSPAPGAPTTKPRIRTWINASLTGSDVVEGHIRLSATGFIAECQMQITERVEGYSEGDGQFRSYEELRERNPNLRPRTRQFRTTGVLLCIEDDWFKEPANKGFVVDRLREIFCREYSVQAQDIGATATNIAVRTAEGHHARSHCIAIYDQTYGSLRLTERAYTELDHLLHRFSVAAEAEQGDTRTYYMEIIESLRQFSASLPSDATELPRAPIPDTSGGLLQVFAAGSRVEYREKGELYTEVEVVMPAVLPDGELAYQVKCQPRSVGGARPKRLLNAKYIEPSADDSEWSYALWDPDTQEYVDADLSEETGTALSHRQGVTEASGRPANP